MGVAYDQDTPPPPDVWTAPVYCCAVPAVVVEAEGPGSASGAVATVTTENTVLSSRCVTGTREYVVTGTEDDTEISDDAGGGAAEGKDGRGATGNGVAEGSRKELIKRKQLTHCSSAWDTPPANLILHLRPSPC